MQAYADINWRNFLGWSFRYNFWPMHWLETEQGFRRQAIRTDYGFASPEEAVGTLEFFFGDELVGKIRTNGWKRVPECTGVWTRQRS